MALRRGQGWLRQALPGDLLQLRDSGGLFTVEDPLAEQPRLSRGELVVTGPIFGAKMKAPPDPSPSALLEQEVLRRSGIEPEHFNAFGKQLPGSRRPVQIPVSDFRVAEVAARRHPAVVDANAVGIPDERFGQVVTLVCSVREPVDEADVIATIKQHIADYKAPKHVVFVDEVYRAPNGKADYRRAKEFAEAAI